MGTFRLKAAIKINCFSETNATNPMNNKKFKARDSDTTT